MQSSLSAALEQAHPCKARACHAELDTRSGFLGLTEVGIIDQMEEIAPMLSVTAACSPAAWTR
ncbi:hypothetical protein [Belnapia rosea]|uniref:hypothetical protein n=1 Tax=Belnapia rosea TaxID=938405 RepID=UPI000B823383|nr:hypothetical protein [Belnapia rosea]